jgi:uncharacterized peroxidase-related enzyme
MLQAQIAAAKSKEKVIMAHIDLADGVPGIRGPMLLSPETTKPLRELVEVLLRSPNTLTPAEREVIATYVSSENDCYYCQHSHGAAAAEHLGGDYKLIDQIKQNFQAAPISDKMKALLAIAGKVQKGGKHVTTEDVGRAKNQGASDKEIHDTVLIAAAFCMYNRYVDGLATWAPQDPEIYREIGKRVVNLGYTASGWERPVSAVSR